MHASLSTVLVVGLPLLMLPALTGCGRSEGPQLATVHGTVTLDGEPLAEAQVSFQPQDGGRPSFAITNQAGEYELRYSQDRMGALIGKHQVRIKTGQSYDDDQGRVARTDEKVPAKYNRETTLVREVEPGGNEIDFELASP